MSHYNMGAQSNFFFRAVEITATQIAMDREIGVSGERNKCPLCGVVINITLLPVD